MPHIGTIIFVRAITLNVCILEMLVALKQRRGIDSMSNQILLWLMLILSWLTLFFMKKEDIKQWLSVGMFAIVTTTIIHDVGTTLGFWSTHESIYPFYEMLPDYYGTMPVLTMWVFKFTYGKFGTYMLLNTVLDIVFNFYILGYFYPSRGILAFNISPLVSLPITLMHAVVLYMYQVIIYSLPSHAQKQDFEGSIQPAAAKPIPEDQKDNKDE